MYQQICAILLEVPLLWILASEKKSPESLLDDWSDIIKADYQERNPKIAQATPDGIQMVMVMNQQTKLIIQIKSMMGDIQVNYRQHSS